MKKQLQILFVIFLYSLSQSFAQAPDWAWAKTISGIGDNIGNSIASDASGNIYTTGYFSGTVDFDPGPGIFNLSSVGDSDIFISKLDISGNFVWTKSMGGPGSDRGNSIALDATGNVYTTGSFKGTTDFNPDLSVNFNLTSIGYTDMFILKLDNSGNFIWAKQMGGTHYVEGLSIILDASENIYTTGTFHGTDDFNPGTGVFNLTGSADIFISKLDSAGNFVWAKSMVGGNGDMGYSIALDASCNVYTTGRFVGTVDFNPGAGVFNLTSAGLLDIFISKLDSSGNFVWAKRIGVGSYDEGYSISVDTYGFVYTTGRYTGMVDFDPGAGIFNLMGGAGTNIFVSKLDSLGNFVWAKSMGGTEYDLGLSIALDVFGNVYTTGCFQGTADFDPGAGTFNMVSDSEDTFDVFISKLDSSGNFVWAKSIGGKGEDYCPSIVINPFGNACITGYFPSPSVVFGSTTLMNANNTGSTNDMFIAQLDNTITGLENPGNSDGIILYPNPACDYFTIALPSSNSKVMVTISDNTGKVIYKATGVETGKVKINTKEFEEGIYLVKIQIGDLFKIKKLIVAR